MIEDLRLLDGERLDDKSIVQEMLLILIGDDETTRHVISGGMLALLENPEQFAESVTGRPTSPLRSRR